jgi:integrase
MPNQRRGYIGQDKTSQWFARVTITDKNGKRRNLVRRAKDKSEARTILKTLIRQLDDEGCKGVDYARLTFVDLAEFYTAHYLKPAEYINGRKASGMKDWKHAAIYLRVFKEHFGRRLIREITYSELRSLRSKRLQTPTQYGRQRSITTVNRELTYLRRIFNIAEREGFINKNPFRSGDTLISTTDEVRRERVLTHDEEILLLNVCTGRRSHLKSLLIAALDTAMRCGELIKLRWSEVFFDSWLIKIKAENSKTARPRVNLLSCSFL